VKILEVCPYDIDRPGGVQRHVRDMAGALAERGHQVTIIAPATDSPLLPPPPGVAIERLGRAFRIGFSGTRFELSLALGPARTRLKSLMRDADVAHFHTVWTPALALQALGFFSGPAVATFHDTPPRGLGGRVLHGLFRLVSRLLLPRFEAVLVPSEAPKGHLVAAPGQAVKAFPPATDLRSFADAPPHPGLPMAASTFSSWGGWRSARARCCCWRRSRRLPTRPCVSSSPARGRRKRRYGAGRRGAAGR
jgi:phosphatidylinositol alpha-mannosyltransferase